MSYGILEVTSGNLTTESFVTDHDGGTMSTRDVVERLNELEAERNHLKTERVRLEAERDHFKSQLRTAGWFPLD
jgi:hypothetical protein